MRIELAVRICYNALMDFPDTIWSLIHKAHLHGDTSARSALETFCEQYRKPVIHFLRQRGVIENRVEDMAHDFLLQLIDRDGLRRADPAKGRFRSYLFAALRHFMATDIAQQQAAKRGSGAVHVNLEEAESFGEIPDPSDPEVNSHDRAWAVNLLLVSYSILESEAAAKGKLRRFQALKPFVLPGGELRPQAEVAQELGETDESIRVEISRLRKRFRQIFREEVARTVANAGEIDDEIQYLREVLRHPGMVIA
jgi:RNA polymerase sigma factor (sigma-70 family)